MNDPLDFKKCPKCDAPLHSTMDPRPDFPMVKRRWFLWQCESTMDNDTFFQTDKCRIAELEEMVEQLRFERNLFRILAWSVVVMIIAGSVIRLMR